MTKKRIFGICILTFIVMGLTCSITANAVDKIFQFLGISFGHDQSVREFYMIGSFYIFFMDIICVYFILKDLYIKIKDQDDMNAFHGHLRRYQKEMMIMYLAVGLLIIAGGLGIYRAIVYLVVGFLVCLIIPLQLMLCLFLKFIK